MRTSIVHPGADNLRYEIRQIVEVAKAIEAGMVAGELQLGEGSWGAGKDFSVWNGPAVTDIAREGFWMQRRWVDLMHREGEHGRLRVRRPDLDQVAVLHARRAGGLV